MQCWQTLVYDVGVTTVDGMAELIEARRRALGLTVQDLIEQTGLTRPGLAPLLRGERRRYQERLTLPVCRVLKWTPDSIDRLLAGGPPVEIDEDAASIGPDAVAALHDQLDQLRRTVDELAQDVAALRAEVADLH